MTKAALSTDYSAVRDSGAGLIDLSARGRVLISGTEAVMFLNGLITNDMNTLAVNRWMPAAFPNVQGRLLAAVRVIHREDGFLIDTENPTRDTVVKLLERFTLAGDFRLADLTRNTALLSKRLLGLQRILQSGDGQRIILFVDVREPEFADFGSAERVPVTGANHAPRTVGMLTSSCQQ